MESEQSPNGTENHLGACVSVCERESRVPYLDSEENNSLDK